MTLKMIINLCLIHQTDWCVESSENTIHMSSGSHKKKLATKMIHKKEHSDSPDMNTVYLFFFYQ